MAAIKKKQTLRSKAASRAAKTNDTKTSLTKYQQKSNLLKEANPFLHQIKVTKKEKQNDKSQDFLERLNGKSKSINTTNGLSKSSLRRQKRKAKSQLKGNIRDLLEVLPAGAGTQQDVTDTPSNENPFNTSSSSFSAPKLNHKPNPHKSQRGTRKVEQLERARFGLIMTDKSYQASPFAALKDTVRANMDKFD